MGEHYPMQMALCGSCSVGLCQEQIGMSKHEVRELMRETSLVRAEEAMRASCEEESAPSGTGHALVLGLTFVG